MNKKGTEDQLSGQITTGIELGTLVLRTINFVQRQLPAWRDDLDRPVEASEDKLNLQLCKFLDSHARNEFPMVRFDHEEYQSSYRRVDLSASLVVSTLIEATPHTIYDPILVFECKRLPAPSSDREKEYVTGGKDRKSGGIQRFKLNLHGADLKLVAMIGYIQKRFARDWQHDINTWILELCHGISEDGCNWAEGETLELLEEDTAKGISCCRSVHGRTNSKVSGKIEVHHLWVAMNRQHFSLV